MLIPRDPFSVRYALAGELFRIFRIQKGLAM
jgi:hypothetical protein